MPGLPVALRVMVTSVVFQPLALGGGETDAVVIGGAPTVAVDVAVGVGLAVAVGVAVEVAAGASVAVGV